MATSQNWQLFVHNGRHNHKIVVCNHGHAQVARLTEEQLQQTEQFRKSHVLLRNIFRIFREQDVSCAVRYCTENYNVVAKIKKNRMQRRNTVEEVLYLSAQRSYTVFYRNCEESNVQYAIIGSCSMTLTGKNFTVAIAFMCNEQHLYVTSAMSTGHVQFLMTMSQSRHNQNMLAKLTEMVKDEEVAQQVWTSQVMLFGVETTNCAESEHLGLKLWFSTYHGDLDTVFLSIDTLIEGQIVEIKTSLEISKLKEKYAAKSNAILMNITREMVENPKNKCLHYLRKLHSLPCAYELVGRCQYLLPLQLEDVYIFWRKLEIGVNIPNVHKRDMDFEMCDLTLMLEEISMGPILKVREVRRLIKGVICPVLPENPCPLLTTPSPLSRNRSHKGMTEAQFNQKGSSGSGFGPSPRGRGRPPHSGRGRGGGRNSGRSSLSSVVNPDSPSTPFPSNNAFLGFMYEFIQNWKNVVGDGNCGFRVVANFLFGDENQWLEIHRRMSYDLHHHMNMVCQNTLPKPELSHNPVRQVRLDAVKVCNESVLRGYPAVLNLLHPVWFLSKLISCHHIQSQANVQQFMFILITQHGILLDVGLTGLSSRSNRRCKHGKVIFAQLGEWRKSPLIFTQPRENQPLESSAPKNVCRNFRLTTSDFLPPGQKCNFSADKKSF
ncbi:hypothetical protein M9H77_36424 [Catharanthus roseus]|uniref:Uncharacterized protein n=1 Tax=Catharanthus roseus TaxID=4058 RepID=A0ACB9ZRT2_CATRO|nr:hypothetical protein M9H77_36424 [Catharanthus roseus]